MNDNDNLKELESDLMQWHFAYANADIDREEFERNETRLKAAIAAIHLKTAKQRMGRKVDAFFKAKIISRQTYTRTITQISKAESEEQLNAIIDFKNAA